MNKKFFAALASATMAFSATGSLAVFAQDFDNEDKPVLPTDQEKPAVAKRVVWNKDNFGNLVDQATLSKDEASTPLGFTLEEGKEYTADQLKTVGQIQLKANFEGSVKGLEYFTGLINFYGANNTSLENTSLDFSANTTLKNLEIVNAENLSELVLPEPAKVDDKDQYSLQWLTLKNTALTSLDLSAQKSLATVNATDGNLNSIKLRPASDANRDNGYQTLNLSNNAFETIDLDYYDFTTKLDLSGNRFGALDLSKTTAKAAGLTNQTFYIAENSISINLLDVFGLTVKDLDNLDAEGKKALKLDDDKKYTGVFDLTKRMNYTYNTGLTGLDDTDEAGLVVTFVKANPMHRLYNPNSGEHFYTADFEEHDALVDLGWNDEGYGWVADKTPTTDADKAKYAVYRLYNANAGDHHYTMDANEVKTLVSYGWKNEGTGWYSALDKAGTPDQSKAVLPVYRQYNPYANGAGAHNYTTDKAENDYLVSVGWTPEGTAWYGLK